MAKFIVSLRAEVHYEDQPDDADSGALERLVISALGGALGTRVFVIQCTAFKSVAAEDQDPQPSPPPAPPVE